MNPRADEVGHGLVAFIIPLGPVTAKAGPGGGPRQAVRLVRLITALLVPVLDPLAVLLTLAATRR